MKPFVDQNKCIGCGACAALCPDVFEMGSDGKSHVKNAAGCAKCDCKRAADSCPVGAITLK
ncbi:Ferredoxin [Candidatus Norongarragalina meridionalis]|nr:Ferredoxin [Candidatus Norongarragalina meridionalis]